jgi:hypothetical protein
MHILNSSATHLQQIYSAEHKSRIPLTPLPVPHLENFMLRPLKKFPRRFQPEKINPHYRLNPRITFNLMPDV